VARILDFIYLQFPNSTINQIVRAGAVNRHERPPEPAKISGGIAVSAPSSLSSAAASSLTTARMLVKNQLTELHEIC